MPLFNTWFNTRQEGDEDACLWLLTERPQQRQLVQNEFSQTVRSHYESLDKIADDIADLGYKDAAKILKAQLPTTAQSQSGDLGEIMATEFTEAKLEFKIPVRRLRYKDGRDMPLRGDDFIGIYYNRRTDELVLLKGESKSYAALTRKVIGEARAALNRDNGRCTPISLLFVASRLMEGTPAQKALGRKLRNEYARKAMNAKSIYHALFTLTGNDPETMLTEDLQAADKKRVQHVINIRITDHQSFIQQTYKKAVKLGNN